LLVFIFCLLNKGIDMAKLLSYISLAVIITFGLFAFMASLISSDSVNITPPLPPIIIEVAQVPEDSKVSIIEKLKLEPPTPPEPMPKSDVTPVVANDAPTLTYQSAPVSLTGKGTTFKHYEGRGDKEARPIVRVNPKYPVDAMRQGTEGWVKLAFDINKVGKVVNISVIDSQPKRIFDKAARQALTKWKYQAKSVDGQAVYQKSRTVQLDFSMEQQS
jgi:protein TonB